MAELTVTRFTSAEIGQIEEGSLTDAPRVSVIVPTIGFTPTLERCVRALEEQTQSPTEILVVAASQAPVGKVLVTHDRTRVLVVPGIGRSSARRFGADHSIGDYLLFVDSDQVAERTVVEECTSAVRRADRVLVTIPEERIGSGFWFESAKLDHQLHASRTGSYPRFVRRDDYLSVGGHSSGVEDFMEDRLLHLLLSQLPLQSVSIHAKLLNLDGRVNPFRVGWKGLQSAHDSGRYYGIARRSGDSFMRIIGEKIRDFASYRPESPPRLSTILSLVPYEFIAHGPRLAAASWGSLLSSRHHMRSTRP